MNVVGAGRTFLFAPAPHDKPHLWLVLTDPDGDPAEVIAVMVCTVRAHTDPTIILQVGDHPFIVHESCVHYSTATKLSLTRILTAQKRGHCQFRDDLSREILNKIRRGLLTSPYTVIAIKEYCSTRFRSLP